MEPTFADHLDRQFQVALNGITGQPGVDAVAVAVDGQLVATALDLGGDLRVALDLFADEEEDRLGAGRIKDIEDGGSALRMRPIVEGERRMRPVEAKRNAG